MKKLLLIGTGMLVFLALFFSTAENALAYTHNLTLRYGSNNSQVMELQRSLNRHGYSVASMGAGAPGFETSFFGALTRAAVIRFQISQSIGADGIVGPVTGGILTSLDRSPVPTPNPTPNNPDLNGNDGTIDDVQRMSQYNDEEVAEGQDDVRILGFEVETSNDGDIALRSLRVSFDSSGTSGSDNLDDYIDSVSVWMDNDEVGSADVDDFSEDGNVYSRTITLDRPIIRSNDTERFYVTVSTVGNLDSGDLSGDSWTISLESIRFEDGSGVVSTENNSGDLPISNVPFDFVDFGTAADTDVRIARSSDTPEEGIILADDNDSTNDIVLLRGTIRIDGDSDVLIDELPVTFVSTGTGDVDLIAGSTTLEIDGEEYTESISTASGTVVVTFEDLDLEIGSGDTVEFEVRVDIDEIASGSGNGSVFDQGDTLRAEINATNRDNIDIENEQDDQLDNSDLSGTAIGEEQEFRSEGATVSLESTSAMSNGDASLATYTIRFKVTAAGDDIYVGTDVSKYGYELQHASTGATTAGVSAAITNLGGNGNSTSTTSSGNWKINEGTTITLNLQVFANGNSLAGGAYRAALTAIGWDNDDIDAIMENNYTSNLETYRTNYVQLL